MTKIAFKDIFRKDDVLYVDTRTPSEFSLDHIPNAINIPLLDDEERKQVGMTYKDDKDKAFELGVDYYSKKLPKLVARVKKLSKDKTIVVYCWRGGMRSKAITQMVELLGYEVYQLDGGYKSYREFIRNYFMNYSPDFRFIVLWGLTGVGKTRIIHELDDMIDLEGLAQHRSSLFGGVGLNPRKQKRFESLLFKELERLRDSKYVFVEGESRKIGDVEIPNSVYKYIKKGIAIKVNASMETRVNITVDEYYKDEYVEDLKKIISGLKQKIGGETIEKLLNLLDRRENDKVAEILLKDYYDPLYVHTIDNIRFDYEINNDDTEKCIQELMIFVNSIED